MDDESTPRATVRSIDGQLVLDDPDALAMMKAVERHNCKATFDAHKDRVQHFAHRITERGSSPTDLVIVLLNVDDPHGGPLADVLMPNNDAAWQARRDEGEIPFARGLATRGGIEDLVMRLDPEIGDKLRTLKTACVVMDHGVVEAFEVQTTDAPT